ncbi:hypothetical protein MKW92_034114, partial [Papaver armeniacum]
VCNKDRILTQLRCAQLDPKHLKIFHSREFSVVVILKSALITSPIIRGKLLLIVVYLVAVS